MTPRPHLLALACCALSAGPALAGAAADRTLSRLPDTVDAAVVIERSGEQLATPQGRALASLAAGSGLFDESIAAWRSLAAALALPPDTALTDLFGRRVLLAIDLDANAAALRWALVTRVDTATEKRIVQRLKATPRAVKSRTPILAIEDARFELAVAARLPANESLLILAPAASSPLLESLLELHAQHQPEPDPDRPEIAGFLRAAALSTLLGAPHDAGVIHRIDWTARPVDGGWRADLRVAADLPQRPPHPFTREAFERFAHGAALALCTSDARAAASAALPDARADLDAPLTGAAALALHPAPPGAPAPFAAALALQLDPADAPARLDALVAAWLDRLADPRALDPDDAPPNFAGRFPEAVRTARANSLPEPASCVLGRDLTLAWKCAPSPAGPVGLLTTSPDAPGAPPTDTLAAAAAALSPPSGEPLPLLEALVIRPRLLAEALAPHDLIPPKAADALTRIRLVSLWLSPPAAPGKPATGQAELLLD